MKKFGVPPSGGLHQLPKPPEVGTTSSDKHEPENPHGDIACRIGFTKHVRAQWHGGDRQSQSQATPTDVNNVKNHQEVCYEFDETDSRNSGLSISVRDGRSA